MENRDEVKGVTVFFSYSHKDEELRNQLETQLALLKRQGRLTAWHDRRIEPGAKWEDELKRHDAPAATGESTVDRIRKGMESATTRGSADRPRD